MMMMMMCYRFVSDFGGWRSLRQPTKPFGGGARKVGVSHEMLVRHRIPTQISDNGSSFHS